MKQQIYHFLPKIDCGRCGYADCSSYADAVFQGACIHLCEAGGNEVMQDLSRITSRPTHEVNIIPKQQAVIDESQCIGCTACMRVCVVDAIMGARKLMHSVIAEECTGCRLCVESCPVNCIQMQNVQADYLPQNRFLSQHQEARFAAAEHAEKRILAKRKRQPKKQIKKSPTGTLNIAQLLLQAQNKAKQQKTVSIRSKATQEQLLTQQKKQAIYRNAQRDLQYGDEKTRQMAIETLKKIKEEQQK
ncbi:MAG: RnfABCDGE type electron transport complex subunit B [Neisseriaceae bacterium]|nr:RnfABCDGE type electron transport complex subunit B [Neisseriaceae bacterium]